MDATESYWEDITWVRHRKQCEVCITLSFVHLLRGCHTANIEQHEERAETQFSCGATYCTAVQHSHSRLTDRTFKALNQTNFHTHFWVTISPLTSLLHRAEYGKLITEVRCEKVWTSDNTKRRNRWSTPIKNYSCHHPQTMESIKIKNANKIQKKLRFPNLLRARFGWCHFLVKMEEFSSVWCRKILLSLINSNENDQEKANIAC